MTSSDAYSQGLTSGTKRLVMTADDFGRTPENNAGILAAFQAGVIKSASLMVAEPAAQEAIDMARQNPALAVGLHLSLSEGVPLSAPENVPLLVSIDGRFPPDETTLFNAVLTRSGRQQMRREIMAQFDAFSSTGLRCNHLDVHRNSHRHPLVAVEVFKATASHRVQTIRIPFDPPIQRRWRVGDPLRLARVWVLRRIAAWYGLSWADQAISRDWSNPNRLLNLIADLPSGVTELFFHPVVTSGDHMFKVDLQTLLDPRVKSALDELVATNSNARARKD
jgi:hopanoid biosynthesis associated protein HpnK